MTKGSKGHGSEVKINTRPQTRGHNYYYKSRVMSSEEPIQELILPGVVSESGSRNPATSDDVESDEGIQSDDEDVGKL